MMKFLISCLLPVFTLMGCAKLPPKDVVGLWDDWEVCHRLADYAFKGNSQWLWYSSEEITKRNLQNDPRCKSVYDARMGVYSRHWKDKKSGIFITFSDALNTSFEEATAK